MDVVATIITALISATAGVVVTAVVKGVKTKRKANVAMHDGLQSLLRAEIIRQHDKHTERGYCPIYAKDALRQEYEAYHQLGGNGVVTGLYEEIMALPETPPNKNGGK